MAYTPTTWINGDSITSSLMSHAETQYDELAPTWGRWYGTQTAAANTTVATGITSFTALTLGGDETFGTYAATAYYDPDYWAVGAATRLVCKKAGYYLIHAHTWHSSVYSINVVLQLYLNNTTALATAEACIPAQDAGSTAPFPEGICDVYNFSADDYLELRVAHNRGSNAAFSGNTAPLAHIFTHLAVVRA